MTERPSPRESARLRKQRQRERQRDVARELAKTQAATLEAVNEQLAPSVMRNPVLAPDGSMVIGPRVQILNGRVMRADPIASCRSPEITESHRRAARQLQLDWHDVGAGVGVGAVDYLRSGGGSGGDGGHAAMLAQVTARGRLEGAMAFLGAFAPAVARVVLDGIPIAVWASEPDPFGVARTTVDGIAWIALALARLSVFYNPPIEASGVRIRALGPAREDYSTEAEAA